MADRFVRERLKHSAVGGPSIIRAVSDTETGSHRLCPYLGIAGDPATHYEFPEGGHRCHTEPEPQRIDLAYQAGVCLGGAYVNCSAYQRASANSTRTRRTARGWATRTARGVAVVLLAVVLLLALAVGRAILDGPLGLIAEPSDDHVAVEPTDPPATAPPTQAPEPTATLAPATGMPTATPSPVAARTASPTMRATPGPRPTPLIHIVQPGESLWFIADLYGVRRRAIVDANELTDPNHIEVGQRLIIPLSAP